MAETRLMVDLEPLDKLLCGTVGHGSSSWGCEREQNKPQRREEPASTTILKFLLSLTELRVGVSPWLRPPGNGDNERSRVTCRIYSSTNSDGARPRISTDGGVRFGSVPPEEKVRLISL